MSDFDKEAEREKLREKYERDKAEREATQRMSDLLLKGATMTNMHCGTCGDPLFKQDGTTFCPSCHGNPDAVEGTDLEAQPVEGDAKAEAGDRADERSDAGTGTDTGADVASRSTDAAESGSETNADRQQTGSQSQSRSQSRETPTLGSSDSSDAADASADSTERDARSSGRDERSASSSSPSSSESTREPSRQSGTDRRGRGRDRDRAPASRSAAGDLETAHASLVDALEKWADEAAAADDPRYAKECLEAAREASETLNALR